MIGDIYILSVLCCFWVGSGAADTFKGLVWRILGGQGITSKPLPPFDCELCLSWWCGIVYLIIEGCFTLKGVLIVALVAWATPITTDVLHFVVELPRWMLAKVSNKLDK